MYYVACNVLSGVVLDVSQEALTTEGHPVIIKTFEGDIPDPLLFYWDKNMMQYERRINRILTHIDFRKLFTQEEEVMIDAFNSSYENNEAISARTKAVIRTGLNRFHQANVVNLDDTSIIPMLGLYASIGIIQNERIAEIIQGMVKQ